MTLEESCNYIEQIAKDPFEIVFMNDQDFEKFLLIEPDTPGCHERAILKLLDMIFSKGGDHKREMIIYKVLAKLQSNKSLHISK